LSLGKMLLKMLFPPRCPFCREILGGISWEKVDYPDWVRKESASGVICSRCAVSLPWIVMGCPRCAAEQMGRVDCSCSVYDYAFDNCCAVGRYTGKVRKALHLFKYQQKQWLAEPLGRLLSWKLSSLDWAGTIEAVVPIPLTPHRQRRRGYNQAALLAGVVGRELGVPLLDILQRVRETESQAGLKREKRWENMRDAFRCRGETGRYGHLLLIDDILTTGATAHQAASVIKTGVAESVSVAVFAR
jgi:ComF family protein